MELVTKSPLGGCELDIFDATGILGKYRSACKAEKEIAFESPGDCRMHVAELRTVAFVENQHHMLAVDLVRGVTGYEVCKFLNSGDDNSGVGVVDLLS